MIFGEQIKLARERCKLSQEDAAAAISAKYSVRLSASYLSMIESGVRTNLTVNLLNALLDFFDLPVEAAATLFTKPRSYKSSQAREAQAEYYEVRPQLKTPAELAALPEHAKNSLAEFQDFLLDKYLPKK